MTIAFLFVALLGALAVAAMLIAIAVDIVIEVFDKFAERAKKAGKTR